MEENLWTPMEIKKEFVQSSAALSKEFGNLNTQIEVCKASYNETYQCI